MIHRSYIKFFILLAGVTILLLWLFPSRKPLPLPAPIATPSGAPAAPPDASLPPPLLQASPRPSPEPSPQLPPVTQALPEVETLRDDVRAHPHETPASLLRFSDVLAARMEDVKKHPDHSTELMREFKDCVGGSSDIPAAQAMCLTNARRLALENPRMPELNREFERIKEMATPETRQIVERISRI